MSEAAITFPILILTAMLMLRVMTFYLEILNAALDEHMEALNAWDDYAGAGVKRYSTQREVRMLRGGILNLDLVKRIDTESFLINEDVIVRAGDLFD